MIILSNFPIMKNFFFFSFTEQNRDLQLSQTQEFTVRYKHGF